MALIEAEATPQYFISPELRPALPSKHNDAMPDKTYDAVAENNLFPRAKYEIGVGPKPDWMKKLDKKGKKHSKKGGKKYPKPSAKGKKSKKSRKMKNLKNRAKAERRGYANTDANTDANTVVNTLVNQAKAVNDHANPSVRVRPKKAVKRVKQASVDVRPLCVKLNAAPPHVAIELVALHAKELNQSKQHRKHATKNSNNKLLQLTTRYQYITITN